VFVLELEFEGWIMDFIGKIVLIRIKFFFLFGLGFRPISIEVWIWIIYKGFGS
jgi:hypothetical protein